MFKQAHSPKYTEICNYNRSFKTLRGLGWVNLKECALSIHKKSGKSAAVLFHLGLALPCARNQNFIFTGFQFIFCYWLPLGSGGQGILRDFSAFLLSFHYTPFKQAKKPFSKSYRCWECKIVFVHRHFLLLTLSFTAILISVGEKNVKSVIMKSNLR